MKNQKLTPENFNPDCHVSPDELDPWIRFFSRKKLNNLLDYCKIKKQAMSARLKGDIILARKLESNLEKIYLGISDKWKW